MNRDVLSSYGHRPLLRQLVDGTGRLGRVFGVGPKPIRPNQLISTAKKHTGLDDFGPWGFEAPLKLLCQDYHRHARLTLAGQIAAKHHLLQLLKNRLHLQETLSKHPEIRREQIQKPIFVLGLPRSGTTLLHGLLAQDSSHRCPITWEVMHPHPAPTKEQALSDPRIKYTDKQLGWLDHLAPGFKTIHPVGALLPQECIAITANAFTSLEFHTTNHVPNYQKWYEQQDLVEAYSFHKFFLQYLQWKHKRERWVLKAPDHLRGLKALLERYPDAIIVQTHRHPLQVAASISSHGTVIRAGFSDQVDPKSIAKEWNEYWASSLDIALDVRRKYEHKIRFIDVQYQDLVGDPESCVNNLYARLGLRFDSRTRDSMVKFLNSNPQDKHGRHRYSLEEFDLEADAIRHRYQSYIESFGL